jgi:hypothetical protein
MMLSQGVREPHVAWRARVEDALAEFAPQPGAGRTDP